MLGRQAIPRSDRLRFNLLWFLSHCLGERRFLKARRSVDERIARTLAQKPEGRVIAVDRRRDLSRAEFHREYLSKGVPVILEGAASGWRCAGKWSPEFFAQAYGSDPAIIVNTGVDDINADDYHPGGRTATLADVIGALDEGAYARFSPILHDHPELHDDFEMGWLRSMGERIATGVSYQFFMGGRGTTTAIHSALGANLFVQVYGEKEWVIVPPTFNPVLRPPVNRTPFFFAEGIDAENPDFDAVPLFRYVDRYTAHLRAGDVLYNPPFFWHQVHNPTTSIGVGYRWYALPSIVRSSATQFLLTLLATNPPAWVARRNRTNFAKVYAQIMKWEGRRPAA